MHQEILQAHPEAELAVYTIWLPMLPTDSRARWDDHVLNDPRVTHLWDEERVVGRWLADHGLGDAPVTWDAYLLFGPDGRWEDTPPDPAGAGAPVIGLIEDLMAELSSVSGVHAPSPGVG
ncbi:MAG: hypothetical protein ACRDZO_18345 [Egibacteraceae bacterium]